MTKSASQILQEARALVAAGWCQGFEKLSSASSGQPTYCIVGALREAAGPGSELVADIPARTIPARDALQEALPHGCICLVNFNDAPRMTQRRVLALFDAALEAVTK